jgi:hypothetical protein
MKPRRLRFDGLGESEMNCHRGRDWYRKQASVAGMAGEYRKPGYVEPMPGTDHLIGSGVYMPCAPLIREDMKGVR